jgi:triphosphatase
MTDRPTTTAQLALIVLHKNAAAFEDRAPGVLAGSDIEDVHQMRVATRRLRAALRLFGDVLPPEASHLHEELSWIADQLGPARDLDVQARRLSESADELGLPADLVPYAAWLEEQRQHAQARLVDALGSDRFQELVGQLDGMNEWAIDPRADADVSEDGPRRLRRSYRRFKNRAEGVDTASSAADLHRVRIRAKWLRYTAEFFELVYGKPARRLARRAVAVQDLLGDFQDGIVSGQRIRDAVQSAADTWPAQTLLALGQIIQRDAQRGESVRQDFARAYRALRNKGWKPLRRTLRRRQAAPPAGDPINRDAVSGRQNGVEGGHILDDRLDHIA